MSASASDSSKEDPPSSPAEQVIEGTGASPGVAVGRVCRYASVPPDVDRAHVAPDEVESELARLDEALSRAQEDLARVRSVAEGALGPDADGTAIFEAQELMLDDDELRRAVRERIEHEHESAAHALTSVLRAHRERLEESDDAYLQERTTDLHELEARLLRALQREGGGDSISPDAIVVAERLTAADIIRFAQDGMRGCVTTHGGATSHAAIIARALGVPAVVGADGATEAAAGRHRALVDGRRGRLILEPTPSTLGRYNADDGAFGAAPEDGSSVEASVETTDGRRVTLQANVDFDETLARVEEHGAMGIGLMRTELFFLGDGEDAVTEEQQVTVYRRAAAATGECGATVRLFDLGGDKLHPGAGREDNPFLGWRGIRVLLDRPDDLLRPQVRALLRANAHGTLRALLPMVTYLDEVRRVRAVVQEEAERLSARGVEHDPALPLGVMVEVPAVALQARKFADVADFLSIGTNDLTQFLLALDRGNERVADRFDALHPSVLGLIRRVVEAGRATDTPVALCGEVAGDVVAVPVLLGLGIRTLSVAPPSLLAVHRVVRAVAHTATEDLARSARSAPDPTAVRRQARDWLREHVGDDVLAFRAPGDGA
jgi:phosphotransferase system enzyme I (PtsI)